MCAYVMHYVDVRMFVCVCRCVYDDYVCALYEQFGVHAELCSYGCWLYGLLSLQIGAP